MSIVAEHYEIVVGVDTHAATHTLAALRAGTGAVLDHVTIATTGGGLDEAVGWILHHLEGCIGLAVVEGIGSYGAQLSDRLIAAAIDVVEPSAMGPGDRRGVGKSDA